MDNSNQLYAPRTSNKHRNENIDVQWKGSETINNNELEISSHETEISSNRVKTSFRKYDVITETRAPWCPQCS